MRLAIAAVLLFSLTACGSSGPSYSSPKAVAKALGCTSSYEPMSMDDLELYVTEGGTCTQNSEDLTINWFKNSSTIKTYTDVASAAGGYLLVGDNWVIEGGSKGTLKTIQGSIGGKIS